MARIRPLTPGQARRSVLDRLGRTVDRVRQVATNLGARPYRVFMVWTKWTGSVRGEGTEQQVEECEILPTPVVKSLDSVSFSVFHAGTIPAGSLSVTEVSLDRYTMDKLRGHIIGGQHVEQIPQPYDFFYEVVEDGRGDCPPIRQKYRLLSYPHRDMDNLQWRLMLERVSEDRDRDGKSAYLSGTEG